MPLTNQVVSQQDQVHIQTQIQEYEQKDAMSTRVIDETTLRIYLPWVPDANLWRAMNRIQGNQNLRSRMYSGHQSLLLII